MDAAAVRQISVVRLCGWKLGRNPVDPRAIGIPRQVIFANVSTVHDLVQQHPNVVGIKAKLVTILSGHIAADLARVKE